MKIYSVTIAPDLESPKEAQRSVVGLVDQALTLVCHKPITDFSEARNRALQEVRLQEDDGDVWALMLDTDERIQWHDRAMKIRDQLEDTTHDMLHVWADDHAYAKPRLFRLPARGHYKGPTHECWIADPGSTTGTLEGITFSELPKTEAQYKAKAERDRAILEKYTQEHPDDPRWWYYLGDTYSGLGQDGPALNAFNRCFALRGWDEESAWAKYRMAEILCKRESFQHALEACTDGISRHPGMAELPWLAGYCCFKLGRFQHAIWWERMAREINYTDAASHRINFRHEPALWEGPADVMSHAYAALGNEDEAKGWRLICERELEARKSRAT